jgi:hypothetical protein
MFSQIDEQQAARASANPIAYAIEDVPGATGLTRTRVFQAIRERQLTARQARSAHHNRGYGASAFHRNPSNARPRAR